jgi:hypothetical protein
MRPASRFRRKDDNAQDKIRLMGLTVSNAEYENKIKYRQLLLDFGDDYEEKT